MAKCWLIHIFTSSDSCSIIEHLQLCNEQIDDLAQDCSNSSALAMELLQSCAKPSKYLTGGMTYLLEVLVRKRTALF